MNELALFAGAGGGILGGKLLGWRTVCAVELNTFCARRLMQRQNEGHLAPFPIWDDVRTFAGKPWRGLVDVVSGGFPCQDISAAGAGAGIDGERSGLWSHMARIIGDVRPRFAFVENSPMLTSRGLGRVLGDLAEMGFDAKWGVISAADVGAHHKRERIWIVAHSNSLWKSQPQGRKPDKWGRTDNGDQEMANATSEGLQNSAGGGEISELFGNGTADNPSCGSGESNRWPTEPGVGRMVDGVANGMDRLRALGNGQVPAVVATAWRILTR